jgi:hypothetical protein
MISPHNTDIGYSFYNDKVKEIIAADLIAEPFTYVPIVAQHMELVGGNAIVFGKITEGYDVVSAIIDTEISYENVALNNPRINFSVQLTPVGVMTVVHYPDGYSAGREYYKGDFVYYNGYTYQCKITTSGNTPPASHGLENSWWVLVLWNGTASYRRVEGVYIITIPSTIYVGSYYYITVQNLEAGIPSITASYKALGGDTPPTIKAGLQAALIAGGVSAAEIGSGPWTNSIYLFGRVGYFQDSPNYEAGDINTVYKDFVVSAYILTLGNTVKYPQLKRGAVHSFGIVYKDRSGRTCSVVKSDGMDLYIPFYSEEDDSLLETIVKVLFKIYNPPPDWAESYEIVYFGNISMDYFLQIREDNIITIPNTNNNRFAIDISSTFDWTYNKNNRWKVPPYAWLSGDRLRLLGSVNELTGVVTKYSPMYSGSAIGGDFVYDYEIEQVGDMYGDVLAGKETAGDYLIFQAVNRPTIFGNLSSIANINTDLNGNLANTTPNGTGSTPVARVDTITLSGSGGTANITVGNLSKIATFNSTLAQTATDFVTAYADAYLDIGIILTQGVSSHTKDLIFTAKVAGVDFPGQSNILIEIYRPRKGLGLTVAYGTGLVFDVDTDQYGHKYHKGDVDQVFNASGMLVTPATVNNFQGDGSSIAADCWKFLRLNYKHNTGDIQPFWAESIFPSDWWGGQIIENKLTSMGFPFLDDLSLRQTILNERIRNGGFLLTGTRTNNIAHFVYNDFRDLPEKDGDIVGLREVGYTLKVIQRYKETSIYINRVQSFNPDGTEQYVLTDTFLGTMRPMDDDYGCQHPDSITVNGRNLYYWDNSQGAFIRSAPNGQQVISGPEYKMSRYFKNIVKWIQTSGGGELLQTRTGINNEHKEVWITFNMNGEIRGLIFSEKNDRYISHIDQITETYIHLGNFFAHLYQQRLWIMNVDEGQDFLSWSGTLRYAEVEIVSNAEPLKNKIFNAVAVFADHLLQSLAKFVHIPREASAVNELMESNIPVWERREGVYFGQIMKDINSKGNFINIYDKKLNGREMRGRYCYVRLHSEEHSEKVRIDSIVVFSTPSERNI